MPSMPNIFDFENLGSLLKSELDATDEILRLYAIQQQDDTITKHILLHLKAVKDVGKQDKFSKNLIENIEECASEAEYDSLQKESVYEFESIWEAISILLGSRCEQMQIISQIMEGVHHMKKEMEEEKSNLQEKLKVADDRLQDLEERLGNTITEEDWIEAKEESSLVRDELFKLKEKHEVTKTNLKDNIKRNNELIIENEDLQQRLNEAQDATFEGDRGQYNEKLEKLKTEVSRLDIVVIEQKETIHELQLQLEKTRSSNYHAYNGYDQNKSYTNKDIQETGTFIDNSNSSLYSIRNPITINSTSGTDGDNDGKYDRDDDIDEGMRTVKQFFSKSQEEEEELLSKEDNNFVPLQNDKIDVEPSYSENKDLRLSPSISSGIQKSNDNQKSVSFLLTDGLRDLDKRNQPMLSEHNKDDSHQRQRSSMLLERRSDSAFSSAMYRRASVATPRNPYIT